MSVKNTISVQVDFQPIQSSLASLGKIYDKLDPSNKFAKNFKTSIDDLVRRAGLLETKMQSPFGSPQELEKANREYKAITEQILTLIRSTNNIDIGKILFTDKQKNDLDDLKKRLDDAGKAVQTTRDKFIKDAVKGQTVSADAAALLGFDIDNDSIKDIEHKIDSAFNKVKRTIKKEQEQLDSITNEQNQTQSRQDQINKLFDIANAANRADKSEFFNKAGNFKSGGAEAVKNLVESALGINDPAVLEEVSKSTGATIQGILKNILTGDGMQTYIDDVKKQLDDLKLKRGDLLTKLAKDQGISSEVSTLKGTYKKATTGVESDASYITAQQDVQNAANAYDEYRQKIVEAILTSENFAQIQNVLRTALGQTDNTIEQNINAYRELTEAQQESERIQRAFLQSFSLNQVLNKAKQAIHEMISTVKDLDKVMTDIAVVTDMSQDDLWGQIGEYSQKAKDYGVSIKGVYEVSQLYYQMGLKTADVNNLVGETLKMARIASIDYADAADYMTVAIRSFNIEMDNAQRVTDVYSALAAATASDTEELAIAMSKTASGAAAVGASFENTSAMLAQMISTTRESAQNLGSALKSVISRYGELKEDPTKLVDSEGEELSLNKVDTALQSIGISLHDVNGQFRNFDEVIIELSSKWDTLDTNAQRYIATVMAGNRQQSRFLALVSDYDELARTMEIANNAEDAAQLQFLKTLDSVDAKLNVLNTTVQEFYTESGVQDVYKGIITFATTVIGNLTEMKRHIGSLPIEAATAILRILPLIKLVGTFLIKILTTSWQGYIKSVTSEAPTNGRTWAQQFTDGAWPKIKEFFQKMKQESKQVGKDAGKEVAEGFDSGTKWQSRQNLGTGIAAVGTAIALSTTNSTVSGIGNIVGGLGSGLGAVASGMMGNVPGAIIQAVSAISGILTGINDLIPSAEKRIEAAKKAQEESRNEYLMLKDDTNTLSDYIEKIKAAEKTRFESEEKAQEYYDILNETAEKYPELVASYDEANNAIIDVEAAEKQLALTRMQASEAAVNAARDELTYQREQLKGTLGQHESVLDNAYAHAFENYNYVKWAQELTTNPYLKPIEGLAPYMASIDPEHPENEEFVRLLFTNTVLTDTETGLLDLTKAQDVLNQLNFIVAEGANAESTTDLGKAYAFLSENSSFLKEYETWVADLAEHNLELNKNLALNKAATKNYATAIADQTILNAGGNIGKIGFAKTLAANYLVGQYNNFRNTTDGANEKYRIETGIDYSIADYVDGSFKGETNGQTALWNFTSAFNAAIENFTTDEINNLNTLLSNRNLYTQGELTAKLIDLNLTEEFINTYIIPTVEQEIEIATKDIHTDNNGLNQKLKEQLKDIDNQIGTYYISRVMSQVTWMNDHIDDATESSPMGEEYIDAYFNLLDSIYDIDNEDDKLRALGLFTNADLQTLNGIYQLRDSFRDNNLDDYADLVETLASQIVPDVTLEAMSYFDTLNGSLKDYEDALKKASKGMSFDDAYKLSQQIGVTLHSFNFVDGKWYFKDLAEVTKALYKKNADIEEIIQDQGNEALEALDQETDYVERQAKLALQVQQASNPIEAAMLDLLSKAMEITDQEIADYLLAIGSNASIEAFKNNYGAEYLGNGKYQLTKFDTLPQHLYTSKSAQEIEEKLIDQRIKQVEEIDNKFLDLITNISKSTGTTQLNAKFLEYSGVDIAAIANAVGAEYENGILTLTNETDLAALVTQLAATDGAQNIADQIADTVFEAFSTYLDLIRDALEGSLNATGRTSLKGKYGLSDDDFIYGAKGYKLNESGLAKTYSQLSANEQADIIKDIYDDLQDNNSELNDSYELIKKIKQLENDINHSSPERTKELKKQRDLYKDILKYQSFNDPDAFDLTKGKLGNQEQSALNTYESAIKLLGEFGKNKEGTVGVEAFHNFVNLVYGTNEEAAKKLFGGSEDVATAADVLRKSWSYLDNVEGEAVIDLAAWGVPLLDGANSLSEATTEALKVIAESEIEQLKGLRKYYETLAKLDEMDVEAFSGNVIGENGAISTAFKNYASQFLDWDSAELFDEFIINSQTGRTLGDVLREAVQGTLENEGEINLLQLVFNELITNSEIEWDPNDVTSLKEKLENFLQELCKELGLDVDLKLSKPTISIEDVNWLDESGRDIRYATPNVNNVEGAKKFAQEGQLAAEKTERERKELINDAKEGKFKNKLNSHEEVKWTPKLEELADAAAEVAEKAVVKFVEYTQLMQENAEQTPDHYNITPPTNAEEAIKVDEIVQQMGLTKQEQMMQESEAQILHAEEQRLKLATSENDLLIDIIAAQGKFKISLSGTQETILNLGTTIGNVITNITNYAKSLPKTVTMSTPGGGLPWTREVSATGNVSLAHGTLMGELGPELVCSNGHYYTVGNNGAEFVNLPDDAIVFNHLQTAGLLSSGRINGHGKAVKGDKKAVGMAHGNAHASASEMVKVIDEMIAAWQSILGLSAQDLANKAKSSGGGGGGGSNDNAGAYTAELERWYNYLQEIDAIEKSISLEEAKRATYTKELSDGGSRYAKSLNESIKKLKQENKILKEFVKDQQTVYNLEMERFTNSKYSSIYAFNKNTGKLMYQDGGLAILSSILEKADNATLGGDPTKIAEQQLQEIYKLGFTAADLRYDAEGNDAGDNIQQMVQNFFDGAEYWKEDLESMFESFTENEEKIANNEAEIQKIQQEKIDNQLELENDIMTAIVDAREKIIEGMQDELKVIEENGQNYIKGLSEALQKERDIYDRSKTEKETATLRNRLAILQRTGGSASEIKSLQDQLDSRAQEAYFQTQQDEIDKVQEALDTQTEQLQKQIDLETEALAFQKENGLLWDQVYDMMNNWPVGEIADFIQANTESLQGNSPMAMAEQLKEEIYKVQIYREEDVKDDKEEDSKVGGDSRGGTTSPSNPPKTTPTTPTPTTPTNTQSTATQINAKQDAIKQLQKFLAEHVSYRLSYTPGVFDQSTKSALALIQSMLGITSDGLFGPQTQAAILKAYGVKIPLFKSGGVDNFTGLAMLHGTKSRPEAVLSADDYQLLKSTLLNQKNGTLANAIRSINELAGTFNRAINGKADGTDVIIENVNLTLTSGVIANSYDARDAARTVKDELLKIARKTGNRSY